MAKKIVRSKPQHPGVAIQLNGETFSVPSLALGVLHLNYEVITSPRIAYAEAYAALLPVLLTALRRNYPEITLAALAEWVSTPDIFLELLLGVQAATGLSPLAGAVEPASANDAEIDWSQMYCTLIRETGWTFEQCREQGAAEMFALLKHMAEHPPTYVILAARYGIKSPFRESAAVSPQEASEVAQIMGDPVRGGLPERLAKIRVWVNETPKMSS